MKFKNLKIENLVNTATDKTKVLFIYPHPDDETMASGCLINNLVNDTRFDVAVISVTSGQYGDELLKLPPEQLGEVRKIEFKKSVENLGVRNHEVWNFTDSKLPDQESEVKQKLESYVQENNIDLLITFEKLGMYGHPDHVTLSKIVHEISTEQNIKALYSTLPEEIIKKLKLPTKLTYKDRVVELSHKTIATPEFKIRGLGSALKKYLGARNYKSQKLTSGRIPLLLSIMVLPEEYYTTKYD